MEWNSVEGKRAWEQGNEGQNLCKGVINMYQDFHDNGRRYKSIKFQLHRCQEMMHYFHERMRNTQCQAEVEEVLALIRQTHGCLPSDILNSYPTSMYARSVPDVGTISPDSFPCRNAVGLL